MQVERFQNCSGYADVQ